MIFRRLFTLLENVNSCYIILNKIEKSISFSNKEISSKFDRMCSIEIKKEKETVVFVLCVTLFFSAAAENSSPHTYN